VRAPDFWAGPGNGGWRAGLLSPLSWLWTVVTRRRLTQATPYDCGIPVICIGNVTAGGTGKTPVAQAVARRLIARGLNPHFLSRGYGGSQAGPLRVEAGHDAAAVGDEPLLLAGVAPAWIARDRVAGARAIAAAEADVIIMDDGFQNPSLAKSLTVLVIDAGAGLGNGRVIPAGPLREPWADALGRADAVIINGTGDAPVPDCGTVPLLFGRIQPLQPRAFAARPVFAFAGIGRPAKFYDTLRAMGARIVQTRDFPDHHPYTMPEIEAVIAAAGAAGAVPVTTAKDAVRLPPRFRDRVEVVEIAFVFEDEAALDRLLDQGLVDRVSKTP
jgi:tetraacyldisaccharide 4'-kinase